MSNILKTMQSESIELVLNWLKCASSQISSQYFFMPVAGQPNTKFRERVYCYELYHRWRQHWPENSHYSLCGEVDKRSHSLIIGEHLTSSIPDFLVHVPGKMDNLLVMEVKPAYRTAKDLVKDLKKLTAFRSSLKDEHGQPANYKNAILWLYGIPENEIPEKRWNSLIKGIHSRCDKEVNLSLIDCYVHEFPHSTARLLNW
jgi:hypothetical protein